jgi:hypothetical protein
MEEEEEGEGVTVEKPKCEEDNVFDPSELQEECDGWEFHRRKKIPYTMVRRYCYTLDQDYTKHKITVCVHIDKIFDLFMN